MSLPPLFLIVKSIHASGDRQVQKTINPISCTNCWLQLGRQLVGVKEFITVNSFVMSRIFAVM